MHPVWLPHRNPFPFKSVHCSGGLRSPGPLSPPSHARWTQRSRRFLILMSAALLFTPLRYTAGKYIGYLPYSVVTTKGGRKKRSGRRGYLTSPWRTDYGVHLVLFLSEPSPAYPVDHPSRSASTSTSTYPCPRPNQKPHQANPLGANPKVPGPGGRLVAISFARSPPGPPRHLTLFVEPRFIRRCPA